MMTLRFNNSPSLYQRRRKAGEYLVVKDELSLYPMEKRFKCTETTDSRPKTKQKKVSFSCADPEYILAPLRSSEQDENVSDSEYLEKFKGDIWYSKTELTALTQERSKTIRLWMIDLLNGWDVVETLYGNDHYCARGLESYQSPAVHSNIHACRRYHLQTVLAETARQAKPVNLSNNSILRNSRVSYISTSALQRAQDIARMDEYEAMFIHSQSFLFLRQNVRRHRPRVSLTKAYQRVVVPSLLLHQQCSQSSRRVPSINLDFVAKLNAHLITAHQRT